MPPKNKNSVELKLQKILDLLQEESKRNVVLGNENETLRLKISLLESALESGEAIQSFMKFANIFYIVVGMVGQIALILRSNHLIDQRSLSDDLIKIIFVI